MRINLEFSFLEKGRIEILPGIGQLEPIGDADGDALAMRWRSTGDALTMLWRRSANAMATFWGRCTDALPLRW